MEFQYMECYSPKLRVMEKCGNEKKRMDGERIDAFSPISTWLNGNNSVNDDSQIQIEFHIRKEMTDEKGFVHKGILCVYIQEAIQTAIKSSCTNKSYEIECFQISYIAKAKLGEKVLVRAKLSKQDDLWNQVECFIQCERRLIARAVCSIQKNG